MPTPDLDLPPEGVMPRPGDPLLSETDVTRLFKVAATVTDDLADQAEIVALCVIAGLDHNGLRRKLRLAVIPDRPVYEKSHIQHRSRSRVHG